MANLILDYRLKPWEIFGGKRPFYVKYADMIADVIKDFKLQPIEMQFRSPTVKTSDVHSSPDLEAVAYIDPDIYGGKRFAHLHYRGEIYMLNREQWQSFTARVKDDLIDRLRTANTISVEQLLDLNDAIDPLA